MNTSQWYSSAVRVCCCPNWKIRTYKAPVCQDWNQDLSQHYHQYWSSLRSPIIVCQQPFPQHRKDLGDDSGHDEDEETITHQYLKVGE